MTLLAQSCQVLQHVLPTLPPLLDVVDVQPLGCSAMRAAVAVPCEDRDPQLRPCRLFWRAAPLPMQREGGISHRLGERLVGQVGVWRGRCPVDLPVQVGELVEEEQLTALIGHGQVEPVVLAALLAELVGFEHLAGALLVALAEPAE